MQACIATTLRRKHLGEAATSTTIFTTSGEDKAGDTWQPKKGKRISLLGKPEFLAIIT